MNFVADGIVIGSVPYGKNSKALTVLSATHGKISVIARGCVSLKSPIHAACNLFTYSEMEITQTGGKYYLTSAQIKELFYALHSNLEKLSLAQYFLEVCGYVAQEESNETELLRLLLNTLYKLCKSEDKELIKAVFEIKLCEILGFMPDIEGCAVCGKDVCGYISAEEGVLRCKDCAVHSRGNLFINEYVRSALNHIFFSDISKIFSFKLVGESKEQLLNFAEKYMLFQTGVKSNCLEFYNSLIKKGI